MNRQGAVTAGARVGPYQLPGRVLLAPMAGISDAPFREICREFGAAYAVGEMTSARAELLNSEKTTRRADLSGDPAPRTVQIVGADPQEMADAARHNVAAGAQIIDINMGCPAKKVARRAAGSALLRDEGLVERILRAVVDAVAVPVTLKMRTGWEPGRRNAVRIAQLAEQIGIAALAIHGRTRACGFSGQAEYATIREVVRRVRIPVFANGDIDSPRRALQVLEETGAAGVMIGRGAQGNPWLLQRCDAALRYRPPPGPPTRMQILAVMARHIAALHRLYGPTQGPRVSRKHANWYGARLAGWDRIRPAFNNLDQASAQMELLGELIEQGESNRGVGL